jgi:hypothetical protein
MEGLLQGSMVLLFISFITVVSGVIMENRFIEIIGAVVAFIYAAIVFKVLVIDYFVKKERLLKGVK